jgi:hypothetical protein
MNVKSALLATVILTVSLCSGAPSASASTGFGCQARTGGTHGFIGHVTAVRMAAHGSYDRFVIQFRESRVPTFEVRRQNTARFVLEGSGRVVTLLGHAGIGVHFDHATAFGSYHGPRDIKPRFPQLREARETGDFEAVYNWGLGVHRNSCIRVFTLHAPARLVIDTRH